jgi:hypothetical protein
LATSIADGNIPAASARHFRCFGNAPLLTRDVKTRFLSLTVLALALAGSAAAKTISVTTTNDSGAGSLRQAIADASSGDTITFSLPADSVIPLTNGELVIDKSLTIKGPGANQLTITREDSAYLFSIFKISGGNVSLSGVTITNGSSGSGNGGEAAWSFTAAPLPWLTAQSRATPQCSAGGSTLMPMLATSLSPVAQSRATPQRLEAGEFSALAAVR